MDNLYSMQAWGKIGITGYYGECQFGENNIGLESRFISRCDYGKFQFGEGPVGDIDEFNGIYQRRHDGERVFCVKQKWWVSKNPRTENQQANRTKFAEAIAAWHELTPEQQMLYNLQSKYKRKTGFNIFIAEQMRA